MQVTTDKWWHISNPNSHRFKPCLKHCFTRLSGTNPALVLHVQAITQCCTNIDRWPHFVTYFPFLLQLFSLAIRLSMTVNFYYYWCEAHLYIVTFLHWMNLNYGIPLCHRNQIVSSVVQPIFLLEPGFDVATYIHLYPGPQSPCCFHRDYKRAMPWTFWNSGQRHLEVQSSVSLAQ